MISFVVFSSGKERTSCGPVSGSQSSLFLDVSIATTNRKRAVTKQSLAFGNVKSRPGCLLGSVHS